MEDPSALEVPLLDAYVATRCEVRLQHSLDTTLVTTERRPPNSAEQRRIDAGRSHESSVLDQLAAGLGDRLVWITDWSREAAQAATAAALAERAELIAGAWLPADRLGRRTGRPDLLVRTNDGYLPVEIKLHLLSTEGSGSLESSPLTSPFPAQAVAVEGRRLRKGTGWYHDALQLAHYTRMLEALGLSGQADGLLGGVIDGSATLWWLDLDLVGGHDRRTPLAEYDRRFAQRVALARTTLARNADPTLPRAADPWFHKECEHCEFSALCEAELDQTDDVSLVRWSSDETLAALKAEGVTTRALLAALDLELVDLGERLSQLALSLPQVIELARAAEADSALDEVVGQRMGVRRHLALAGLTTPGELLGRDPTTLSLAGRMRDLGRLVRRARAHVGGGVLLQVPAEDLDAARGDVEVDVDMESYEHATYLWGAYVTTSEPLEGIEEGYHPFVTFEQLDDEAEAAIFTGFWGWLSELRDKVHAQGRTFRAYCFWRAAEESQMRRAAGVGGPGLPTMRELERFFESDEWVDLHQLARDQLLTEGPLGLKVLASHAGFSWRDEDPSGEASIGWYEEAVGPEPVAAEAARRRLLEYNEDDVLATRALRRWLDGPARQLPHVEEVALGDR